MIDIYTENSGDRAQNPNPKDVVFAAMPFGDMRHPALGLTLLRAALDVTDIQSSIEYFTLQFAERIGIEAYDAICNSSPESLIGEWVFSRAAFDNAQTLEDFRRLSACHDDTFWAGVERARSAVPEFLADCAAIISEKRPKIVGFTSTFQQHVASIALARRIKHVLPEALTIIGGANCEGPMGREILRQCTFLDAIASGEADASIVSVMKHALEKETFPNNVPGLFTRENVDDASHPDVNAVADMDALPFVHFDDFLEQYDRLHDRVVRPPNIMFETSRGCWWGQKHHCTFCGLNGGSMTFRSKTAPRALEELNSLQKRHPGLTISVVDNILDMRYFQDFLPELARQETRPSLFYETKANLRKDQVRLLRDAGVGVIQPGIESLSSDVLKIMRKGITMLQNVQLLKWCRQFRVSALWNVLYAFPGESPDSYADMADLLPILSHLQPPNGFAEIRLDRFSPNFEQPEAFGFADIRPYPAYSWVYPFGNRSISEIAYFFTYSHANGTTDFSYVERCSEAISKWKGTICDLFSMVQGSRLLIGDTRDGLGTPIATVLEGTEKVLYEACDSIRSISEIFAEATVSDPSLSTERIIELLDDLVARKIMIREGNKYLSLAVPVGDYGPTAASNAAFLEFLRERKTVFAGAGV